MASFFRNTFDNLLSNLSSTINSPNSPRNTPPFYTNPWRDPRHQRSQQQHQRHQQAQPHHHQQRPQQIGRANMDNRSNTRSNTANISNSANPKVVEKFDIQDIRDPSDINNLTAKQLKTLLTRNCVDYKGVFEKEVLREKVMLLWIDHNESQERIRANEHQVLNNKDVPLANLDEIEDKHMCKICWEREVNSVLLDCGHLVACVTCGRKLADCPICRQNVVRCVRTFKA